MLPVFRRFSINDMPKAPEWLSNLLNPLNLFCEQVVNMFNKNLTIGENVQGQKYTITFSVPNDGVWTPIYLPYNGGGTPTCILVGKGTIIYSDNQGTAPLPNVVSIYNWTFNKTGTNGQIVIKSIDGTFGGGVAYQLNLVVL